LVKDGVIPKEESERHLPPPLLATNKEVWELYCVVHDQYRVLGFDAKRREVRVPDLAAVSAVLELYQVEDKPATLEKILLIFYEMNS